jgi:hypothetical protein
VSEKQGTGRTRGRSAGTGDPGPADGDGAGRVRRGLALLVAGALFMEILDGTVVAPAAPHIAASFGVPPVAVNVVVTAYVLTLAAPSSRAAVRS